MVKGLFFYRVDIPRNQIAVDQCAKFSITVFTNAANPATSIPYFAAMSAQIALNLVVIKFIV